MKTFIATAALAVVSIPAFAQQPAPTAAGDDRRSVSRPDIVARFEVRRCVRPPHWDAGVGESGEVVRVGNVVAIVVAHSAYLVCSLLGNKDRRR